MDKLAAGHSGTETARTAWLDAPLRRTPQKRVRREPRCAGRRRAALALTVVLLAAPGLPAAPTYPLAVRLVLDDAERCPNLEGAPDCAVVPLARAAFEASVARLFVTDRNPELELGLSVQSEEIAQAVLGLELELLVNVRVRAPDGRSIDELAALGRASMVSVEPETLARARERAAEDAARDFERRYATSTAVSDYLSTKRGLPAAAVGVPRRGDRLVTLALGLSAVQGAADGGLAPAPSMRLIGTLGPVMLQAMGSSYASAFKGVVPIGVYGDFTPVDSTLTVHDVGLEAGAVVRFTPSIEFHAGPGVHWLFGDGAQSGAQSGTSFSKLAPSLFTSVSWSFLFSRTGPRFVFGAEARAFFWTTVGVQDQSRTLAAANTTLGAYFGVELPTATKGTP